MDFVVDESTGTAVAEFLRGLGHDVLNIVESLPQADDPDILKLAAAEKRIVVTNDKDFGELVFRSGRPHRGVILLRLRDESAENRVRVVASVLERWANRLSDSFTVATEGKVRIRPMRGRGFSRASPRRRIP
ncbi:MAG TPA: DUF5615 family PIN-like protein [Planctomycetota bacterium]|nr:DUF5615 family PIN-like protein [Planctomycetota bacterium]HRR79035.1 DUF5615 family PIN-like protein [Planctomycetota bacterium]HRT95496.1 DUF5615 family PIN-like protein [Planctomycetota bacterium]